MSDPTPAEEGLGDPPVAAAAEPPTGPACPFAPASTSTTAGPPPARRSTYLRSGTVALLVVAVIGLLINFFLLQHHSGSTVDGGEISQRISQGIQANTGASEPPQVACPRSLPASEIAFECTLEERSGRVVIEVHRRAGTLTWTVTNRPAPAVSS